MHHGARKNLSSPVDRLRQLWPETFQYHVKLMSYQPQRIHHNWRRFVNSWVSYDGRHLRILSINCHFDDANVHIHSKRDFSMTFTRSTKNIKTLSFARLLKSKLFFQIDGTNAGFAICWHPLTDNITSPFGQQQENYQFSKTSPLRHSQRTIPLRFRSLGLVGNLIVKAHRVLL